MKEVNEFLKIKRSNRIVEKTINYGFIKVYNKLRASDKHGKGVKQDQFKVIKMFKKDAELDSSSSMIK
jgi:hypothetical protein